MSRIPNWVIMFFQGLGIALLIFGMGLAFRNKMNPPRVTVRSGEQVWVDALIEKQTWGKLSFRNSSGRLVVVTEPYHVEVQSKKGGGDE